MVCLVAQRSKSKLFDQGFSGSVDRSGKTTTAVEVLARGAAGGAVRSAKVPRVAVPVTPAPHAVGAIASVIVRIASVYRA